MTRGEIRARVRVHIDEPVEERWKDIGLNSLINKAIGKVAAIIMALDESWYIQDDSFSITATELFDLPSDFLRLKELVDENGNPLNETDASKRSDFIGRGETKAYYFQKSKMGFLDVPNAVKTYPFKYVYTPKTDYSLDNATDDTKVPDVPVFLCHDLIAVYVAIEALDLDEEIDTYLIREAKSLYKQINDVYYKRSTDGPRQVESDPDLDGLDE